MTETIDQVLEINDKYSRKLKKVLTAWEVEIVSDNGSLDPRIEDQVELDFDEVLQPDSIDRQHSLSFDQAGD